MRYFYSLFLASAVAFSGFAAGDATHSLRSDFVPKVDMQKANFSLNAFRPTKVARPVKNRYERNDDTRGASPIEGTWTFIVGDNYFNGSQGYVAREFEATVDENNLVTFTCKDDNFFVMKATYNPKTHSLIFNRKTIGGEEGNYIFQEPFTYNWETGELNKKSIYAYYNPYEDAIVFQDDLGIAWTSYAETTRQTFKGYYDILDVTLLYHPEVGGEWTSVGDASFTDGWLAPGFGDSKLNNTYSVPLEQNIHDKNLYRLVNPYKYGPLASTNECTENGYIVFDVTDPDHVIFKFANAGYVNKEKGCTMFFVYNYFGSLCLINPYFTPEEILNEIDQPYPYTTFKNGVISFDNSMSAPDTRFGLQFPPTFAYYWKDANGKPAAMNGSIVLPTTNAVDRLDADSEVEAEYFNLQGLPVVNPEPGQIVIKRQGNVITKEVVR